MIKLIGLDESPTYFEKLGPGELPSYKQMLCKHIGSRAPKDEDNAIALFTIGQKIFTANNEIDLENSEFKLAHESAKDNNGRYVAYLQGQLLLKLQECIAFNKQLEEAKKAKAPEAKAG